jgi:hypothetical protein
MNAILFQPTGEVRSATENEWYMTRFGDVVLRLSNNPTVNEYPIFTRHEIPAEVAKRMMEEAR